MTTSIMSCALAILAVLICADALIGGVYLFRAAKFLRRLLFGVTVYALAYAAGHSQEVAEALDSARIAVIALSMVVTFMVFYDLGKIIHKDRRHRRGSRRTTPARN